MFGCCCPHTKDEVSELRDSSSGTSEADSSSEEPAGPMMAEQEDAWVKTIEDECDDTALERLRQWHVPQTQSFFMAPSGHRLHLRVMIPRSPGTEPQARAPAAVTSAAGPPAPQGSPPPLGAHSASPPQRPSEPKAVLLYCHGLNGHVNMSYWVDYFQRIADEGFCVLCVDIMGHGHSEGERAFIDCWHKVFRDLEALMEAFMGVAEPAPGPEEFDTGLPEPMLQRLRQMRIFTTGNSMGGMIGLHVGLLLQENKRLQHNFGGAVVGYPSLAVSLPPPLVQALLRNLVAPFFKYQLMPPMLSASSKPRIGYIYDLSKPEMRGYTAADIRDDALRFPGDGLGWRSPMRWGTANAFSIMFGTLDEDLARVKFPFLVIHDPDDKVCFISGSEKLMKLSPSEDKTLTHMDSGGFHALAMVMQEQFVTAIAAWINKRL